MGDVRGLGASLGTSAVLVAAAVASLLSFSVVFALGGFEGAQAAGSRDALVLDVQAGLASAHRTAASRQPDVLVADQPAVRSAGQTRARARPRRASSRGAAAASAPATSSQISLGGAGDETDGGAPATPATSITPAAPPNLGDSVQQLGDGLSSTLKDTGDGLAKLTAPLSQPVSAAVQQIVNGLAALLQQATNGLGDLLGAKPKK